MIGLVTARVLEERGHDVRVVATATGDATTSAVAGAVWFPYRCGPPERVAVWAARTRDWLTTLTAVPDAGVDLLTGYEITNEPELPYWAAGIVVDRAPAPVVDAPIAWRFRTVRAEPTLFLAWLARGLRHPIEQRTVVELAAERGVVVDCTGLAARTLTGDLELEPLFGQVVITEPGDIDLSITVTDDRDPDKLFYLIPRRDQLVLGGCSLPWSPGEPAVVQPEVTARILAHARRLGLRVGRVIAERAGLRPFRKAVRLERDPVHPHVIHCYGHGGAGFTLSRGCAEDVSALVAT